MVWAQWSVLSIGKKRAYLDKLSSCQRKNFQDSRPIFTNFSIKFEEFIFIRRSRSVGYDACVRNLDCLFIPKVEIWLIRRLREYFPNSSSAFANFSIKFEDFIFIPKVEIWLIRHLREYFHEFKFCFYKILDKTWGIFIHSEGRDLIDSTLVRKI